MSKHTKSKAKAGSPEHKHRGKQKTRPKGTTSGGGKSPGGPNKTNSNQPDSGQWKPSADADVQFKWRVNRLEASDKKKSQEISSFSVEAYIRTDLATQKPEQTEDAVVYLENSLSNSEEAVNFVIRTKDSSSVIRGALTRVAVDANCSELWLTELSILSDLFPFGLVIPETICLACTSRDTDTSGVSVLNEIEWLKLMIISESVELELVLPSDLAVRYESPLGSDNWTVAVVSEDKKIATLQATDVFIEEWELFLSRELTQSNAPLSFSVDNDAGKAFLSGYLDYKVCDAAGMKETSLLIRQLVYPGGKVAECVLFPEQSQC